MAELTFTQHPNGDYSEALAHARVAAENASGTNSNEQRESWSRVAQAWIAIAREIREVNR